MSDATRHIDDSPARARVSDRKRAANLRNSKLSTGPKDPTSTRFNALKHCLLAEGVTELDSPETFRHFCAQLEAELKPVGLVERFLAQRLALGVVRLKRAVALEAEFLTAELNPPVEKRTPSEMSRLFADMDARVEVLDPGLPARLCPSTVERLADSFSRYETMVENRLFRTLNQLERMQRLRRGEAVPAPASLDFSVHQENQPVASFGKTG